MPFNGRAIYDEGVFDAAKEDVSDEISMISPYETPLLDKLTPPQRPATNVLHEWLEERLSPNTIVSSTAISTDGTAMAIHLGNGSPAAPYLQVGAQLKNKQTGEYHLITAITGNTITITRGFGGTAIGAADAGDEYFVIADTALEGADVVGDISGPRIRKSNYCQIFKKDIVISGTVEAVSHYGVSSEYEHQKVLRMKEFLRDLEKATINGKTSLNTLGSDSAYRTFKGLIDHITTNVTSTGTLTPDILDNIIGSAWSHGGECDLIVADSNWKRAIDSFNNSRVQVVQGSGYDEQYKRRIVQYESTYGVQDVILCRWMPANSLLVLNKDRVKLVPLAGRSVTHQFVAKTGDATKGMIIGEYTLEVRNEEGMARAYG